MKGIEITVFSILSCFILLQESVVISQRCTPVDYPPFLDRHVEFNMVPFQVPHPLRFLIISFHFGCDGTITKWDLYTVNNGSHPIEFQVWREDVTISSTVYRLVGNNYFPDAQPDSNNLLSLPVPEDQQISVQPGDIVGISTIESADPSNDFTIQDYILQGTIVLYTLRGENASTPPSLAFQEVNARFSILHYLPVMNITVVPTALDGGAAPGTDPMSGTSPTSLPQSTVIAVASSAALLALLSIALFITVVSCCVVLKRVKTRQQKPHPSFQPHQQNSVLLDYNPAYNDRYPARSGIDTHHQYQEQQTEPYYSLVTQEEDVTASGTHDSYVEIQPSYRNDTK